jgi:hypothetical protein
MAKVSLNSDIFHGRRLVMSTSLASIKISMLFRNTGSLHPKRSNSYVRCQVWRASVVDGLLGHKVC